MVWALILNLSFLHLTVRSHGCLANWLVLSLLLSLSLALALLLFLTSMPFGRKDLGSIYLFFMSTQETRERGHPFRPFPPRPALASYLLLG